MLKLVLPQDPLDTDKMRNHLVAYFIGYTECNAYELNFMNGGFYPHPLRVEQVAKESWSKRNHTPNHVISCAFNQAGLQDRRQGADTGKWLECLKKMTETSKMQYSENGEDCTATVYTLNAIKLLKKQSENFEKNLMEQVFQIRQETQKSFTNT